MYDILHIRHSIIIIVCVEYTRSLYVYTRSMYIVYQYILDQCKVNWTLYTVFNLHCYGGADNYMHDKYIVYYI